MSGKNGHHSHAGCGCGGSCFSCQARPAVLAALVASGPPAETAPAGERLAALAVSLVEAGSVSFDDGWAFVDSANAETVAAAMALAVELAHGDETPEAVLASVLAEASTFSHDPFDGTHSHAHPAYGAQGGDATHDHEHAHSGDSNHGHDHASMSAQPTPAAAPEPAVVLAITAPFSELVASGAALTPWGYLPSPESIVRARLRNEAVDAAIAIVDRERQRLTAAAGDNPDGRWHAYLFVEGLRTSDGRAVAQNALTWRDFPLPLEWARAYEGGHYGKVVVGAIESAERVEGPAGITLWYGQGTWDLDSEDGAECARQVALQGGTRWVSADVEVLRSHIESSAGGEVDFLDVLFGDVDGDVYEVLDEGRGMGACYDDRTEVLTERRGWQHFAELTEDDRVATRNPKTGEFEWQLPFYSHLDHWDGPMVRFTGGDTHRTLDLLVTPNHRMLVHSTKTGEPMFLRADELAQRSPRSYRIPLTSSWLAPDAASVSIEPPPVEPGQCGCGCGQPLPRPEDQTHCVVEGCTKASYSRGMCNAHYQRWYSHGDPLGGGPSIKPKRRNRRAELPAGRLPGHARNRRPFTMDGDDFAAFMGMWLSEGCLAPGGVQVAQQQTSKGYGLFAELMERIAPGAYYNGRTWRWGNRRLNAWLRRFGTARQKYVPAEIKDMSARQLRIFLQYFMAGDGDADGRRAYTSSHRLADDLVEIAQKVGMWAVITERSGEGGNEIDGRAIRSNGPRYVVQFRNRPQSRPAESVWDWKAETVERHVGDVRCVSVPNEALYVRRNGIPVWCGNTVVSTPAFPQCVIAPASVDLPVVEPMEQTPDLVPNLVAAASIQPPADPPAAWFDDPGFSVGDPRLVEVTDRYGQTFRGCPLTVTDDGRVYGHVALWGFCHTGFPNECVLAPHSRSGYAYFRTGAVRTAEGTEVPVGQLTVGTKHADGHLRHTETARHYDHTGMAVADLASGEDDFGVWVSGALRPGITDDQLRAVRAASPSGDWRLVGGSLELVAVLDVNVPGFPVPRSLAASLVAAGAPADYDAPLAVHHEGWGNERRIVSLTAAGRVPRNPLSEFVSTVRTELAVLRDEVSALRPLRDRYEAEVAAEADELAARLAVPAP